MPPGCEPLHTFRDLSVALQVVVVLILLAQAGCGSQRPTHQSRDARAVGPTSPATAWARPARNSASPPTSPAQSAAPANARERALVTAARRCVGDEYDANYYAGGPPPRGRGACTDVLYTACLAVGCNLQSVVEADLLAHVSLYPTHRDRNIDYRWCPNLIVWFGRHATPGPLDVTQLQTWRPGDIVFWSLTGDGVADHCGVISDRRSPQGRPLVIHNFPPSCREDDALTTWTIVGHFRG
jgi:uncharacterized protein